MAAMLLARDPGPARWALAIGVLLGSWVLGDGLLAIARAHEATATGAASATLWVTLVLWALGGFALGYALPAWAGTFVGRRVTFGTGWASAGVVAASLAGAIAAITGAIG